MFLGTFVLLLLAYFAGAIPFGVLVAKRRGVEIREHGSGNIGATNVTRILGAKAGAVVLLLDALKGAIPVLIAMRTSGDPSTIALVGMAAIVGHCFSPFLGFTGGKGVATAFGVFLTLSPSIAALAIVTFVLVLRWKRVPALGSLAGVATIALLWLHHGELAYGLLALATLGLLIYTHRSNLAKL